MVDKRENHTLCCSFCGKSQKEVKKLIAGPTVYICDGCIKLCNDILAEEGKPLRPGRRMRNWLREVKWTWFSWRMGIRRGKAPP